MSEEERSLESKDPAKNQPSEEELEETNNVDRLMAEIMEDKEIPSDAKRRMALLLQTSVSGPIPSSREVAGYEKTLPGSANRIITMAENQSNHRQEIEKMIVSKSLKNESESRWMAFLTVIILMVIGTWLAVLGKTTIAGIVFGTTIIGVSTVFITGWNKSSD